MDDLFLEFSSEDHLNTSDRMWKLKMHDMIIIICLRLSPQIDWDHSWKTGKKMLTELRLKIGDPGRLSRSLLIDEVIFPHP